MSNLKPDNIYVNLSFYCKKANPTDADVPCVFYANRVSPILEDASDYKMSIARIDFDSQNLPILIPSVSPNPANDIDLTDYIIRINQNGGTGGTPTNLIYVPRNKYQYSSVPAYPGADTPYYYINNVSEVVDMFNTACATAAAEFTNLEAPFMVYNKDNTFSIYFDAQFETDYTFSVNDALCNLFRNFNYTYGMNGGINNNITVQNRLGLNAVTLNSKSYLIETQSYPSFSVDWSPVSSIVITSQYLPIVSEERIPTINILTGGSNSSNDLEQQITDIVLNIENPNDYNTRITYVASTDYRAMTLTSREVRELDLRIYWRSKTGSLYPLLMSDSNSGNAKLKFEKLKN